MISPSHDYIWKILEDFWLANWHIFATILIVIIFGTFMVWIIIKLFMSAHGKDPTQVSSFISSIFAGVTGAHVYVLINSLKNNMTNLLSVLLHILAILFLISIMTYMFTPSKKKK